MELPFNIHGKHEVWHALLWAAVVLIALAVATVKVQ